MEDKVSEMLQSNISKEQQINKEINKHDKNAQELRHEIKRPNLKIHGIKEGAEFLN